MVEKYSIDVIPDFARHGKEFSLFTLWFAANLTLADFALGVIFASFGLPFYSILLGMFLGTALGGVVLAVFAVTGPLKGKNQMTISQDTYGKGNVILSSLQWVNSLGWFTINLVLGTFAIMILIPGVFDASVNISGFLVPGFVPILVIVIYALTQVVISIYGHDIIHKFEKIMSGFLGIMFLYISINILYHGINIPTSTAMSGSFDWWLFGIVLAVSFSYIASWSPYAADYSRYLSINSKKMKVFGYTFMGSVLSTFWLEVLGLVVGIVTLNLSLNNSMQAAFYMTNNVSYILGVVMIIALVLGGLATNSINIYSNSLALNSIFRKHKRSIFTVFGGIIGIFLAFMGYNNFWRFYESFLLLLAYWIMPWAGVLIADFFVVKKSYHRYALISFFVGWLISIPFINPGSIYEGPIATALGGLDLSYFVSFAMSFFTYTFISRQISKQIRS